MNPRRHKRGLGPGTRGRHKKRRSRETRRWERMFKRNPPPPPEEKKGESDV